MKQEIQAKATSFEIIKELGDLPAEAVISEQGLGKIFDRHRVSIKRAVERGELPPSIRLFGERIWTIKALREHLSSRLDEAKRESERFQKNINELSA
ncbi:MAG: hypothetical protein JSU94_16725 [Phycisphaerales bacterium]|nr:MAG: hypothetical protein JSU94_16725 [Phycisphaerales bacterium]